MFCMFENIVKIRWNSCYKLASHSRSITYNAVECSSSTTEEDMPVEMENPYVKEVNRCTLCGIKIDYKNVQLLSQYVSSFTGVPFSERKSALCERKYTEIIKNIRLARRFGYMPYRMKETAFSEDPNITGNPRYDSTRRAKKQKEEMNSG